VAVADRRATSAFWLYASHLLGLFGLAVSNGLLALALLAAPWTLRQRFAGWRRGTPLLAAAALYLLFLLAAIAASSDPLASLASLSEFFALAALPLAVLSVRGERQTRRLVDLMILAASAFAVHGLVQYFFGYGGIDLRIRGPFSHYMTFSGVLLVVDLLLVAQLVRPTARPAESHPFWRLLARPLFRWSALALINVALLGSLTRSAWVAVAVAFTGLALARAPRLLAAYLPVAALLLLLAPVPWVARALSIVDLDDTSNYDRLCMAAAGAQMIAEQPLLGIGPDQVKIRYPLYRHPTAPRFRVPHLHDTFLQVAAERGLLSLVALLALLAVPMLAAWRGLRRAERAGSGPADLHLGVMAAVLGFAVAGLFEHNWGDVEVQRMLLAVMAMPFCLREDGSDEPA
jgi:O-antigen ligase